MEGSSDRRFRYLVLGSVALHAVLLVSWRTLTEAEAASPAETLIVTLHPASAPPSAAPRDELLMPTDEEPLRLAPEPDPVVPIEDTLPEALEDETPLEPLESAVRVDPVEMRWRDEITTRRRVDPPPPPPAPPVPPAAAPPGPAIHSSVEPPRQGGGPEVTYRGLVVDLVRKHKYYPRAARARAIEGTALVRFVVGPDGTLAALEGPARRASRVRLVRSSGATVLDRAARTAIRRASSRFPPLPPELKVGRLEFEFEFSYALVDEESHGP